MKIVLRAFVGYPRMRRLARAAAASGEAQTDGHFIKLFWPSAACRSFLREVAADRGELDLQPSMAPEEAEVEDADLLEVRGTYHVLLDEAASAANREAVAVASWIGEDPATRYKIPERVCASQIRLPHNHFGLLGDLPAEQVMTETTKRMLERAALTGFGTQPVYRCGSREPLARTHRLFTEERLGTATSNVSTPRTTDFGRVGVQRLGYLSYEASVQSRARDFNRTSERCDDELPAWIVCQEVRRVYRECALKGWRFEPVLTVGSDLYREYLTGWQGLLELLGECRRHKIAGRRFRPFRSGTSRLPP